MREWPRGALADASHSPDVGMLATLDNRDVKVDPVHWDPVFTSQRGSRNGVNPHPEA